MFTLALALLCVRRTTIALSEYEGAINRAVAEPHPGRRRAVLRDARNDVRRLLRQGRLGDGPDVRRVLNRLAEAAGEPATATPS